MNLIGNNLILTISGTFFVLYGATHFLNKPYFAYIFQIITALILSPITFSRITLLKWKLYFFIGCIIGVFIFGISLASTTREPIRSLVRFIKSIPTVLHTDIFKKNITIQGTTAIWEELFWRACIQGAFVGFISTEVAVIITSFLFWSVHTHRFKNSLPRMIELFSFSLVLGTLFEVSQSIVLCATIHFIRNMLIIGYRIHVVKANE